MTKRIIKNIICILVIAVAIYSCDSPNESDNQSNEVSAVINDSLDITICFNENNNVSTLILNNKNQNSSWVYGYRDDGVTPVLSGKDVNGQRDGLYLTFYSNGFLNSRSYYSNGELDGCKENFSEEGELEYKALYKNGNEQKVIFGSLDEFDENDIAIVE